MTDIIDIFDAFLTPLKKDLECPGECVPLIFTSICHRVQGECAFGRSCCVLSDYTATTAVPAVQSTTQKPIENTRVVIRATLQTRKPDQRQENPSKPETSPKGSENGICNKEYSI